MRGKRGWIRIVEAVIALLLIVGVVLTLINSGYLGKEDISERVYEVQLQVLREIEKDPGLRQVILEADDSSVPSSVQERIDTRMPEYLGCDSKICELNEICSSNNLPPEEDVYAQSVAITATATDYNPKQLKVFCWVK